MTIPEIPLDELTVEEDEQMLELIAKVVQLTAKSPMDLYSERSTDGTPS